MIIALAGGVGGAKLANGLSALLPPEHLLVVVNTGDDFTHLGLRICPDIDTVTYNLAGINNRAQGWGRHDESWTTMSTIKELGGPDWFALGDKDMATHILRTQLLQSGFSLSAVTAQFAHKHEISHKIVPMSDDSISTIVETEEGDLAFQEYFVRRKCEPIFRSIRFEGAESASPQIEFLAALDSTDLEAIVFCPSNPLLSIAPILSLPKVADKIRERKVPCVAISPFIGGKAIKGPAAKIMLELGKSPSTQTIAEYYAGLIDGIVIDHADAQTGNSIVGATLSVAHTLMQNESDQRDLARHVLNFVKDLALAK